MAMFNSKLLVYQRVSFIRLFITAVSHSGIAGVHEVSILCYWLVMLPVSAALAFPAHLAVPGAWRNHDLTIPHHPVKRGEFHHRDLT